MKKATNRILSFLTAFAMVIGVLVAPFTSANAAGDTTKTLTIHKILMDKKAFDAFDEGTTGKNKDEFDGNEITNVKDFFLAKDKDGKNYVGSAEEIKGVYFKLQKPAKNVTDPDVNTDSDWEDLGEDYEGLTTKDGLKINDVSTLKGKYRIVEDLTKSTYKSEDGQTLAAAKAVPSLITLPLVNNGGVVENAHVYPKNTQEKPQIDKNFGANNDLTTVKDDQNNQKAGANYDNYQKEKATVTANLGKQIPYEVKTKIKKDSKYKKLVWNDNMTKGLTYQKDLKVEGAGLAKDDKNDDYFVTETDRGFTLVLKDSGLTKVENAAKEGDVEITLTYSAKINGEAVVDQPELNDIALDYANKPGKDSEPKEFTPGKKEITVKKSWDITGDDEITEADKGVTAYFTLQKKNDKGEWEDVETVEKTVPQTKEPAAQDSFTHTFKKLDEDGTYRVVESVKGYEADYQKYNPETGEIEIVDHKDTDNPDRLNPTEPKVQLGGRKFVKTNNEDKTSDKLERLVGAEFWVKNADDKYLVAKAPADKKAVKTAKDELDAAVEKYNKMDTDTQKSEEGQTAKADVDAKQKAYNEVVFANASEYTWEAAPTEDQPDNRVVLKSDEEGRFEISGLEYKKGYKLEEKTAPKGFAKLQSDEEFEVKDGSYASTNAELQYNKDNADNGYGLQIKNKNVTIPQTGGIGSLIFIVAGLAIMGLAFVMKRRNTVEA